MSFFAQYGILTRMRFQMMRNEMMIFGIIQVALSVGLVLGLGYIVPDVSDTTALFLTTGTATQAIVTIGLVATPQILAMEKQEGRLEYMLTLPISREAYILAQITYVAAMALPGVVIAVALGAWHYGFGLDVSPLVLLVIPLAILSLAGVGIAMATLSPHQQLTNALTQLIIFYVLFFAPVIAPKEQLPEVLQRVSVVMPPTYAADAIRASLTGLPGTHLARSLIVMAGFAAASTALASLSLRRRG
ncbi:MAG: ABC transporter permease [Dehalococcoidia bacterium]|nr:ABC transporter permease [Dehalococcoidia bacterium]